MVLLEWRSAPIHGTQLENERLTMDHIRLSDTTPLCPVIHDPFTLSHKFVEDNGSIEVDKRDSC